MVIRKIFFTVLFSFVCMCILYAQEEKTNQLDNQGNKTGIWKKYYENGNVRYEGTFKNNKPIGILKRYYPGGILQAEMYFSPDGETSYTKLFYKSGKIAATGKYINNQKDSTWLFYSFYNGRIAIKEDYKKGDLHGFSYRFYDNGDVSEKTEWEDGQKNGLWEQYYENDSVRLRTYYSNGLREGIFESWHNNGKPSIKGQYKEGVMDGLWHHFNEEGELQYTLEYIKGKMLPNPEYEKLQEDFSKKVNELLKEKVETEPNFNDFR